MADISKLLKQAEEASKRKSYDLAIELYQQILMLDSDSGEARLMLRETELRKCEDFGDPSAIGAALASFPNSLMALINSLTGKPDRAAVEYEKILARNPKNASVSMKLGSALERTGNYKSAHSVYKGITLWDKANFLAHLRAGEAARKVNKLDEALGHFEFAKNLNPKDKRASDAHRDISAVISMKPREGASTFRELIKNERKDDKKQQKPEQKADSAELQTSIQKADSDPSDKDSVLAAVFGLEAAGKIKDAFEILKKARKALPADKEVDMRFREIRVTLMENQLQKLESKSPEGGPEVEKARSELVSAKIGLLKARIEREPTRYDAYFDLGILQFESGEFDDAIGSFQQARKDAARSREAAFWLGRGFLEKKKFNLAANQFEGALETGASMLSPKAKETLYFLGKARLGEGDPKAARKQFERIYEEDINFRDVAKILEELT